MQVCFPHNEEKSSRFCQSNNYFVTFHDSILKAKSIFRFGDNKTLQRVQNTINYYHKLFVYLMCF